MHVPYIEFNFLTRTSMNIEFDMWVMVFYIGISHGRGYFAGSVKFGNLVNKIRWYEKVTLN